MAKRQLASWLDGFDKYTENLGSPAIFRKWAGIFTLAAALERKVWTTTAKGVLYPNLYVVLVGPPGVGKTLATSIGYDLMEELEKHHLAPTSVTKASLIDALNAADRHIIDLTHNPPKISFNSLTIMSDELGVLIPEYSNDFMNILTAIYDCRVYAETRRSTKLSIKIDAPQLNLIAATTPSYLSNLIPEGAWDQGFMSRVIMIYSGEQAPTDLFKITATDKILFKKLQEDLKSIGENLFGAMTFTPEAAEAITDWHMKKGPPRPEHPRLNNYSSRRTAHLLNLSMIASVSISDSREITFDHFAEALGWLLEAETFMTDIFKSMSSGGDMKVIEEAYYFVYEQYMRGGKKPIVKHRLVSFLAAKVPAHQISHIVEAMKNANLIEESFGDSGVGFIPRSKEI